MIRQRGPNTVTCLERDDPAASPEIEARTVHSWTSTGLDNDDRGTLVSSRRCAWCGTVEHKTYGATKGSWRRPVKPR